VGRKKNEAGVAHATYRAMGVGALLGNKKLTIM
jgi:hypothetical protein